MHFAMQPAARAAAAGERPAPDYLVGKTGRVYLQGFKPIRRHEIVARVSLGHPDWLSITPLLREIGVDLGSAHRAVATAQADMLASRAMEIPIPQALSLLQNVLQFETDTLLPLAAALIRRVGIARIPKDVLHSVANFSRLPASLDLSTQAELFAVSPEAFRAVVQALLGSITKEIVAFANVSTIKYVLPPPSRRDPALRRFQKLCGSITTAIGSSTLLVMEASKLIVEKYMETGFPLLATARTQVTVNCPASTAAGDPCHALVKAAAKLVDGADVDPTTLRTLTGALDSLIRRRETALRSEAQEHAVTQHRSKSKSVKKFAFTSIVYNLDEVIREAALAVMKMQDHQGFFSRPVVDIWPALRERYLADIAKPMDFGTIRDNADSYKTLAEAQADARLVWENCRRFNRDQNQYPSIAKKCYELFVKASDTLMREAESRQAQRQVASAVGATAATGLGPSREAQALVHAKVILSDPSLARALLRAALRAAAECAKRGTTPSKIKSLRLLVQSVSNACSPDLFAPSQVAGASPTLAAPARAWSGITWVAAALGGMEAALADGSTSLADTKLHVSNALMRACRSGPEGLALVATMTADYTLGTHRPWLRRAALAAADHATSSVGMFSLVLSSFVDLHAESIRFNSSSQEMEDAQVASALAAASAEHSRDALSTADATLSDTAFLVQVWFPRLLDKVVVTAAPTRERVPDYLFALSHERLASVLELLQSLACVSNAWLKTQVEKALVMFVTGASGRVVPTEVNDDIATSAQIAFDSVAMTQARAAYDRLSSSLAVNRLPLGLRNPRGATALTVAPDDD
jgi:hypothetical protein